MQGQRPFCGAGSPRRHGEKIMLNVRKSEERGHANHGWLDSHHSFSFASYQDEEHVHFGPLRVINEDHVAAGRGFSPHPHADMEILTYVISGELAHRDSMGNGSTLRAGDTQRMGAGTGVVHSEFNSSQTEPLHLMQIWLMPTHRGGEPQYGESHVAPEAKRGRLAPVAAPQGEAASVGALGWRADARLLAGLFDGEERAERPIEPGRRIYAHVVRGQIEINGVPLAGGDALKIENETRLVLEKGRDAEVLIFDLA